MRKCYLISKDARFFLINAPIDKIEYLIKSSKDLPIYSIDDKIRFNSLELINLNLNVTIGNNTFFNICKRTENENKLLDH